MDVQKQTQNGQEMAEGNHLQEKAKKTKKEKERR